MNIEIPNFIVALPEILVLVMGCIALLVGLFAKRHGAAISFWLVLLTLVVATVLLIKIPAKPIVVTFMGSFIYDPLAVLLKVAVVLCSFAVFLYSREYVKTRMPHYQIEYYVLGLFAVLGMMVLISAYDFLTLFLGLELFSLPVYAMVALQRENKLCSEAAMKYFVVGSLASAILLYGLSMIYGVTQTISLPAVAQSIATTPVAQQPILVFGLVFAIVGIAFKLGAVPFHMWVPDVYQGAPSSATLFIASAPKIAGLALALRLLVDAMPGLSIQWQQLLIVIALLSMGYGNIVAIVQSNLKRMLAYSSIAHIGYMSLGLLTATPNGYAASHFYMIAYAVMTLVAFGMIVILSRAGFEAERIEDFQGLNSRSPLLAFVMLIVMFSMAGIPPLVGFMAKVAVLEALIEVNMVWLATIALVFAIIGAYYYIKVVKVMYFEPAKTSSPIVCPVDVKLVMTLNGLLILALGVVPGVLFHICQAAFL
ncbi:MAG: NADH-quinone oxidoreductase subunit NuoN [Coxiellaceae bacterium]|nr:MAG: NADH-quinone oxidoreductase subunit NuoN [Coxiellaceae bacterium]